MANTFRVVTKADLPNSATNNSATIYTVPSATTAIVLGLAVANTTTSSQKLNIKLVSATTVAGAQAQNAEIFVAKDILVPSGATLEFMSGQKYVMGINDVLKVYSENDASFDIAFSFMEIT